MAVHRAEELVLDRATPVTELREVFIQVEVAPVSRTLIGRVPCVRGPVGEDVCDGHE